ncbi:MAG: HlyD family efflux transporter periplasmic adaptor subunit [Cytophagaceae bacterium]
MKREYLYRSLLILSGMFNLISCNSDKAENHESQPHAMPSDTLKKEERVYYCPMDPEVEQNKPGICPACNMDLEVKPLVQDSAAVKDYTLMPVSIAVLSNVKSIKPEKKSLPVTFKSAGYITYDTRRVYAISARIAGRIEKLHVKYKFQPIVKGQALLEIYSHELLTAQNEYLYLKRTDPDEKDLLNAAKKKLLLLGMTEAQINAMKHNQHVHPTTTIYSPYAGFVIEKSTGESLDGSIDKSVSGSMTEGGDQNMKKNSDLFLKEGDYVGKGESIFKVANTETVWGIFEVYSDALPWLKLNQPVKITLENSDEMIMGKINFIEPSLNEGAGTTKIRVYLDNKDQNLKIGNLLTASIEGGSRQGLWIPATSVVNLGKEKIVFIKKEGAFETRKIVTGTVSGNFIEVLSGINETGEIAENAHYLMDSESFIKTSN